jgi:hypothetical protein
VVVPEARDVYPDNDPEDAPAPAPAPLPEAPASVNVRLTIGGREVQWTLRDADEARLAVRLEALLQRYPLPQPAAPAPQAFSPAASPAAPVCPYHGPLKASTKAPGTWYCTARMADGSYCKSRHPER